jgi:hypothetical protein
VLGHGRKEKEYVRSAKKDQKELNSIGAQIAVVRAGVAFWNQLALWGVDKHKLSDMDMDLLRLISQGNVLSDKQSKAVLGTYSRLRGEGFPYTLPEDEGLTLSGL